jgi:hypothetical protein
MTLAIGIPRFFQTSKLFKLQTSKHPAFPAFLRPLLIPKSYFPAFVGLACFFFLLELSLFLLQLWLSMFLLQPQLYRV